VQVSVRRDEILSALHEVGEVERLLVASMMIIRVDTLFVVRNAISTRDVLCGSSSLSSKLTSSYEVEDVDN
jgi:hypothetical protein